MPAILLSLISSGAVKWISILILVFGLVSGLYIKHRQIVNSEKQIALQEYNINQLQENVKSKETYIRQMEEISKNKSEIVAELYIEKDKLEEKLASINSDIDKHIGAGRDRESSQILKDTFKALGEMK